MTVSCYFIIQTQQQRCVVCPEWSKLHTDFDSLNIAAESSLAFVDSLVMCAFRVARGKVKYIQFMHAYLRNHISKRYHIFCACYLWPWFRPPVADAICHVL